MGAAMPDLLAAPQRVDQVERLVEHRTARRIVVFLAEGRQLSRRVPPRADAEHQSATGQLVDRGRLAGDHLRPTPRQRRDERTEP
jgi:hypothetical protein